MAQKVGAMREYSVRDRGDAVLGERDDVLSAIDLAKSNNARGRPCVVVRNSDNVPLAYYGTKRAPKRRKRTKPENDRESSCN